jgi:hypothetical protein
VGGFLVEKKVEINVNKFVVFEIFEEILIELKWPRCWEYN